MLAGSSGPRSITGGGTRARNRLSKSPNSIPIDDTGCFMPNQNAMLMQI